MMTREQFEAHVRAEAERKYPIKETGRPPFPNEIGYWVTYDANRHRRSTYIAARMEHEWPVVAALYAIMAAHGPGTLASEYIYEDAVIALSPYTTKPTDQ